MNSNPILLTKEIAYIYTIIEFLTLIAFLITRNATIAILLVIITIPGLLLLIYPLITALRKTQKSLRDVQDLAARNDNVRREMLELILKQGKLTNGQRAYYDNLNEGFKSELAEIQCREDGELK